MPVEVELESIQQEILAELHASNRAHPILIVSYYFETCANIHLISSLV